MTKLEAKKAAIASVEEEATCLSNRLGPRVETVKRAAKRSFDDMAASLNKRREEMDLQTDSCFKEVEENTKKRLEELKLEKVRLETTLDLCRSSQGLSFPPQLLSMKSKMIGRVDECLERELPKVSKMEADINFSNKDEKDLLEIIPSSGVLYSSWTNAANTLQPLQGILSQTRRQLKTCTRDKRIFQEQLRRRNEELVNTREILSDTRNQLNVCQLAKVITEASLRLRTEELDENNGTLSETRAELRQTQEDRRHSERQLDVCVEKMRNASSLIEKASFKFTFQPKFYAPLVSSKKVLKTIPWFIEVKKDMDIGAVSCYLKICNGMLNKSGPDWECRMKATFQVETSHGEPIILCFEYDFTNNSHGYGFPELIPKWRLRETTGTIKLRVDVEARESKGLVPLEDRLREEFNETLATLRR